MRFAITLLCAAGSTAALTANVGPLPSGWAYVGCLYEGDGIRILNQTYYPTPALTPDFCATYCGDQGLPYAAMEIGNQCFCGDALALVQASPESECSFPCGGDSSLVCGGYAYMTLLSLLTDIPSGLSAQGSSSGLSVESSTTSTSGATSWAMATSTVPLSSFTQVSSLLTSLLATTTSAQAVLPSLAPSYTPASHAIPVFRNASAQVVFGVVRFSSSSWFEPLLTTRSTRPAPPGTRIV
ncbi:hypothetical protein P7C73_g999, partial [Tremellales sp. Uapishka_1]